MKIEDYIGKKFGRLLIVEESEPAIYQYKYTHFRKRVKCKCDCGKDHIADLGSIIAGRATSCGCYGSEFSKLKATKHGKHGIPEYKVWKGINRRCNNPNGRDYKYYGGKGIKVCDRWKNFENFFEDMGERPSSKHTIERKDGNKDYCPENCKWATWEEQNNNPTKCSPIKRKHIS